MKLAGMDLTAEDVIERAGSTPRPWAAAKRLPKPFWPASWGVTWPKPKPR